MAKTLKPPIRIAPLMGDTYRHTVLMYGFNLEEDEVPCPELDKKTKKAFEEQLDVFSSEMAEILRQCQDLAAGHGVGLHLSLEDASLYYTQETNWVPSDS